MNLQTEMDFGTSSGKTCAEFCPQRTTRLAVSWPDLWVLIPPSSHRQEESGPVTVWSLDHKEGPRGLSKMGNFLESPNDAAVRSLSQILETGPIPQRFFLSQKACQGILRRAEKRGKVLPTQLHQALSAVAAE